MIIVDSSQSLLEKLPLYKSSFIIIIIKNVCNIQYTEHQMQNSYFQQKCDLSIFNFFIGNYPTVSINQQEELFGYNNSQSNKQMSKKSKSNKPQILSKSSQAPKITQIPQQVPNSIPNLSSNIASLNVQQQQGLHYQQVPQQVPIQPNNNLFTNAQQQQLSNAQQQQQLTYAQQLQKPILPNAPIQQLPQRSIAGVYGNRRTNLTSNPNSQIPAIFNDDQPFKESVKQVGKQPKIDVSLVAQRSQVKLGEVTVLPAMCSIASSGGSRTSVDLICVIDVSGSMSGQKIELVRQTMKVLVQTLTPADRLSIITFQSVGERICPLKAVTQQNMILFSNYINNLHAGGGTSIMSGMELALKTIRDRKISNKVTSVFLLSDGQDKGAEDQLKHALAKQQNKELGVFSIHSFGFGKDHDQDLMNKICTLKDGSFYFIKELSTLDEAFCNALGGIISLVASQIVVQVRCIAAGIVEGVRISKVFGDKWQKINEIEYKIKITQLMSEITKQFVFQLTIPAIGGEVGDLDREHVVLEGILAAKGINGQQMGGVTNLSLTLINTHEEIAEINENVEVIENYLRVKAAQAIEENMKKAEASNYQQAQKGIDLMINSIQSNKKARKEKMEVLVKDLEVIREKCSKQEYQQEGRKWMVNAQNAHSNKANFQYSNAVQSQMVAQRKSKKASYF